MYKLTAEEKEQLVRLLTSNEEVTINCDVRTMTGSHAIENRVMIYNISKISTPDFMPFYVRWETK